VAPLPRASGGPEIVTPPPDDSAIIVGNGGRTVLFGGTLGNYNGAALGAPSSESAIGPKTIVLTQGDWMAENIADYLLHVIFVDGFESTDFGAWSSETGGIFLAPQRGAAKH